YDPVTGRFTSVDPVMDLTDPTQWNAYSYAQNSPITLSDPDGNRPLGAGDTGCSNCRHTTTKSKNGKTKKSWSFENEKHGSKSVWGKKYTGRKYTGGSNYQPIKRRSSSCVRQKPAIPRRLMPLGPCLGCPELFPVTYTPSGFDAGPIVNFFIPIEDAESCLNGSGGDCASAGIEFVPFKVGKVAKWAVKGFKHAIPQQAAKTVPEAVEGGGRVIVGTPRGTIYDIPEGWAPRVADNGKGIVYQRPGAEGNADMIRIMEPTPKYPDGYARVYNSGSQPVDVFGKPGPPSTTHVPETYRGPWPGWPR
ncbi:MAG: RHS repeat-associated core domain-containing protein, partial [Nocardioides sp.]